MNSTGQRGEPLPALRAVFYLLVVHLAHVVTGMFVTGLASFVLAAGHLPMFVLFAATALLFRSRCRIGGEGRGGHGEHESAQKIFGFHDLTPIIC